jgi:hypothetical protein
LALFPETSLAKTWRWFEKRVCGRRLKIFWRTGKSGSSKWLQFQQRQQLSETLKLGGYKCHKEGHKRAWTSRSRGLIGRNFCRREFRRSRKKKIICFRNRKNLFWKMRVSRKRDLIFFLRQRKSDSFLLVWMNLLASDSCILPKYRSGFWLMASILETSTVFDEHLTLLTFFLPFY